MQHRRVSIAPARADRRERGAALVIAILVLAILTVIGIALMLITSTESRIAANEWSVNRGFYSADAGVRWGTVQLNDQRGVFLTRPEFGARGNFFGTVLFQMPSHRHGPEPLRGRRAGTTSRSACTTPGRLGRRPSRGGILNEQGSRAQYMYQYEVRATGGSGRRLPAVLEGARRRCRSWAAAGPVAFLRRRIMRDRRTSSGLVGLAHATGWRPPSWRFS